MPALASTPLHQVLVNAKAFACRETCDAHVCPGGCNKTWVDAIY
jgi:hypothetical protein